MKSLIVVLCLSLIANANTTGQTQLASLQRKINKSEKYLFYLHGGVIQAQGIDAVSPYWGRYEYTAILDTLAAYGHTVISEARPKDTEELEYADKIAQKIVTLLQAGVPPEDITVVGASAGGSIAIDISIRVKNSRIKYAVLGVCRWPSWKTYLHENELCGNYLSIYERSDLYGSCKTYFKDQPCKSGFKEIELNMNNGHGFLYKPYKEWVYPLFEWIDGRGGDLEKLPRQNANYDYDSTTEAGSIKNEYESKIVDGDKIVIDHARSLIWQHGGSENEMKFEEARLFVNELNARNFADHNDWRLPTLLEATSLIEARKNESGLYTDPVFGNRQRWIWTVDQDSVSQVWLVNLLYGFSGSFHPEYEVYVRCVRGR